MASTVFLHGWGMHPVIWEELLPSIPHSVALPLPGYAGSQHATSLEEISTRLAEQIDPGSRLVGWSLGGLAALRLVLDHPGLISELILIGTTPCFINREDWNLGIEATVFDLFAESLARDYADTIRRFLFLQAQGSDDVREILVRLRHRLLALPKPADKTLNDGLSILHSTDLRSEIHALQVPVTLIHGTCDKLATVESARWFAEQLPHTILHEIPRAGHAPFLSHRQQVANLIVRGSHG